MKMFIKNVNDHRQRKKEKRDTDENERGNTEVEIKIRGLEMVRTKMRSRGAEERQSVGGESGI